MTLGDHRWIMYSEQIAEELSRSLGPLYLVLAFGWFAVPLFIVAAAAALLRRVPPTGRAGFLWGVAVAAWASGAWLAIPYCGVYPNLPGAAVGGLLFGVGAAGQEWAVHATNFVLWPLLGLLFFRSQLIRRMLA
jgi:hypothetical protein